MEFCAQWSAENFPGWNCSLMGGPGLTPGQMCSQSCHLAGPRGTHLHGRCLLEHNLIVIDISAKWTGNAFVKFVFLLTERQGRARDTGVSMFPTSESRKPSLLRAAAAPGAVLRAQLVSVALWPGTAGLTVGPQGVESESPGRRQLTTQSRPFGHLSHCHGYCWAFIRESFVPVEHVISRK